jgi:hypothetical protein
MPAKWLAPKAAHLPLIHQCLPIIATKGLSGSFTETGLNSRMQLQASCRCCTHRAWNSPSRGSMKQQGRPERSWLVPASSAAPSHTAPASPALEQRPAGQPSKWHAMHQVPLGAAAVAASLSMAAAASAAAEALQPEAAASAAAAAAAAASYTPGPVEVGWEIWAGFVAGVIPFVIASVEFGKRVVSGGWPADAVCSPHPRRPSTALAFSPCQLSR